MDVGMKRYMVMCKESNWVGMERYGTYTDAVHAAHEYAEHWPDFNDSNGYYIVEIVAETKIEPAKPASVYVVDSYGNRWS